MSTKGGWPANLWQRLVLTQVTTCRSRKQPGAGVQRTSRTANALCPAAETVSPRAACVSSPTSFRLQFEIWPISLISCVV